MKKKMVESSLGVKTTESMARRIDAELKSLPRTAAYEFRRKTTTAIEVQPSDRTDISTITTSVMDRDGEIVVASGVELKEYQQNPIVLFGHDQDKPCGKALWVKPDANGVKAKSRYTARPSSFEGDWFPDFVWAMVAADVLRGKSIGFLPLEVREPTEEEIGANERLTAVITRSLLIEFSVVSCPSNPLALVESINKGVTLQHWHWKVLGKVRKAKPPKIDVNAEIAKALKAMKLDPDKIAQEAVERIAKRWEV